jgi:hypothetical protein
VLNELSTKPGRADHNGRAWNVFAHSTLGSWVRIPFKVWKFVFFFLCLN